MASIILYFSRAGENYVAGSIRTLQTGNTQVAAELLQRLTGADLFPIVPLTPYSDNYNECIEQAKNDLNRDARPALASYPTDLDRYDTIYLGYPNYCGTMPMPVFTLLDHCDLRGKTLCPFCTHEGSGLGRSEGDLRTLCPGADLRPGLAIVGGRVQQSEPAMRAWLRQNRQL